MKRHVSGSSSSRGTIAVLLVAFFPAAFAEPLRVADFEYFPAHLAAEPPPLEAVGPEQSTGLVFVPDSRPGDARWLRGRFDLDAPPQNVHALYISAANRGVRAFVNGVEVGSTSLSDAERFGWNYPLFFSIPPSLLQAGSNTLDLHLRLTSRGWGSLRDAQLGPHDALKPLYDRVLFWRVTGPQVTSLIAVLTGAVAFLVWLRRRHETVFAWFALACLTAAIRNAHFYVAAPLSERWYEVWAAVPLHWGSVALVLFALRLCERRFPRLEKTLLWAALIWSVVIVLAGERITRVVVDLGYLWLVVVNVGLIGFAVAQVLDRPKVHRILLLVALLVTFAFGALDFTLLTALRDSEWRVYMLPYSTLLISLVMGAVLVDAFARARVRQEQINRELDARLAVRERQLHEQHETLLRLERERAMTHERQRILRDIHDGLGSQLLSSIHLVEGGALEPRRVADLLRECVDDLRLAIDSLKPSGNDLLAVLGNFRYRMEPRLAHAGIRLEWSVSPDASSPELSSEQVLHVLRIVQEAVTNGLKHARPSVLRVRYEERPATGEWLLTVEDDGEGFTPAAQRGGDGLKNMRTRAAQAGLGLRIDATDAGTTVRVGSPGAC
jgi:signal transduction histidine kinase